MVKPKNKYSLSHVRHDPAHCLAPGLFRALKRGERKRSKLDVTYDYGDGKRIEFKGPEPLGADDLRILQGLVAMAGPNGLVLSPEPKTEGGQQLRLFLEPKWEAVTADAMVVKGSYRALAREIGYAEDGGSQFKAIRECIERLWTVSIIAQNGRKRQGFDPDEPSMSAPTFAEPDQGPLAGGRKVNARHDLTLGLWRRDCEISRGFPRR